MKPAFDADIPERITRIEFEEVSPGCLQWRIWTDGKLNHVELIRQQGIAAAIETTLILLEDLNYCRENGETSDEANVRLEHPRHPGRFDGSN